MYESNFIVLFQPPREISHYRVCFTSCKGDAPLKLCGEKLSWNLDLKNVSRVEYFFISSSADDFFKLLLQTYSNYPADWNALTFIFKVHYCTLGP